MRTRMPPPPVRFQPPREASPIDAPVPGMVSLQPMLLQTVPVRSMEPFNRDRATVTLSFIPETPKSSIPVQSFGAGEQTLVSVDVVIVVDQPPPLQPILVSLPRQTTSALPRPSVDSSPESNQRVPRVTPTPQAQPTGSVTLAIGDLKAPSPAVAQTHPATVGADAFTRTRVAKVSVSPSAGADSSTAGVVDAYFGGSDEFAAAPEDDWRLDSATLLRLNELLEQTQRPDEPPASSSTRSDSETRLPRIADVPPRADVTLNAMEPIAGMIHLDATNESLYAFQAAIGQEAIPVVLNATLGIDHSISLIANRSTEYSQQSVRDRVLEAIADEGIGPVEAEAVEAPSSRFTFISYPAVAVLLGGYAIYCKRSSGKPKRNG